MFYFLVYILLKSLYGTAEVSAPAVNKPVEEEALLLSA